MLQLNRETHEILKPRSFHYPIKFKFPSLSSLFDIPSTKEYFRWLNAEKGKLNQVNGPSKKRRKLALNRKIMPQLLRFRNIVILSADQKYYQYFPLFRSIKRVLHQPKGKSLVEFWPSSVEEIEVGQFDDSLYPGIFPTYVRRLFH